MHYLGQGPWIAPWREAGFISGTDAPAPTEPLTLWRGAAAWTTNGRGMSWTRDHREVDEFTAIKERWGVLVGRARSAAVLPDRVPSASSAVARARLAPDGASARSPEAAYALLPRALRSRTSGARGRAWDPPPAAPCPDAGRLSAAPGRPPSPKFQLGRVTPVERNRRPA